MKRTAAALCLSLVIGLPALASEAFILNIPIRGNVQQETGEVRATLELSAAPAGAQLVVNGTTTLNLGDTASVGGDSVKFEALTGNDVRITYKPLSNFGANFCAGAGATEKNVPMRFVGAQDVVAWRMSTYIVAAPMAECSQVSKHTGDTPAMLIANDDGVAPPLDAIYKGRNPYDVVLVLDKSGSMSDLPPGANSGATKVEILKSAVQGFVAQWEQIDAPPGGGPEWSHDRLGLVFFDASATPQSLAGADPPANFFLQRGNATAWNTVINQANTIVPGSSTSIGAGINSGMQQWKNDPKNDLSVIVVTDGMQNTNPLITVGPTNFLRLDPVAGLPDELRKRFIPIQTIGFGTPAQVDEDLLRNISFETSGVSYIAANASTMFDVFGMTLVALLKGNTASIAAHRRATFTGAGPSPALSVPVDRSAQRVVVSVQWAPPTRNALVPEVSVGGHTLKPTRTAFLPQTSVESFDLPRGDSGTWDVVVKRADKSADPVPYTLNVFFLERHLDYQLYLDNLHGGTGDKLQVRAVMDWDGKPLTGLPDGAIKARIARPRMALGTILHQTRRDVPSGNTKTPAGDIQTPLDVKIASMTRSLLERTALEDVATVALREQGKGVYTATFDDTSIPGTYAFDVVIDWDAERTGHVHREERLEETVKVKADPASTIIKLDPISADVYQLTLTPRDRFGNYLGPGYASRITARVRNGKLRSEVPQDRDQTGVYVFTIGGVPRGETPQFDLFVDGVLVTPRKELMRGAESTHH